MKYTITVLLLMLVGSCYADVAPNSNPNGVLTAPDVYQEPELHNPTNANYMMTCYLPTGTQQIMIENYIIRSYGVTYVRTDGLQVFTSKPCDIVKYKD